MATVMMDEEGVRQKAEKSVKPCAGPGKCDWWPDGTCCHLFLIHRCHVFLNHRDNVYSSAETTPDINADLLAALEWALSELDVWEPEETHPDSEYQAKKAAARAVSTNARGETSHG